MESKRSVFWIVAFVMALFGPNVDAQQPYQFSYDSVEAGKFARGLIESFARVGRRKDINLDALNFEDMRTASAIDGAERRFVYVSFKWKKTNRGFEVIFEVCNSDARSWVDMSPVVYSEVANVFEAMNDFVLMRGDPTALYPRGCP